MFTDLLATVKEFLTSKKLIASVATIILALAAKYKLNLDPTAVNSIVATGIAYVLAQGVADHGKAAAKVEALAAHPTLSATKTEEIKNL